MIFNLRQLSYLLFVLCSLSLHAEIESRDEDEVSKVYQIPATLQTVHGSTPATVQYRELGYMSVCLFFATMPVGAAVASTLQLMPLNPWVSHGVGLVGGWVVGKIYNKIFTLHGRFGFFIDVGGVFTLKLEGLERSPYGKALRRFLVGEASLPSHRFQISKENPSLWVALNGQLELTQIDVVSGSEQAGKRSERHSILEVRSHTFGEVCRTAFRLLFR
jgi:hypothetical protein